MMKPTRIAAALALAAAASSAAAWYAPYAPAPYAPYAPAPWAMTPDFAARQQWVEQQRQWFEQQRRAMDEAWRNRPAAPEARTNAPAFPAPPRFGEYPAAPEFPPLPEFGQPPALPEAFKARQEAIEAHRAKIRQQMEERRAAWKAASEQYRQQATPPVAPQPAAPRQPAN